MLKILKKRDNARYGIIKTAHGEIRTPFFMPDATRGYVKGLSSADLESVGVGPMVVNTFHLYLQPGMRIIKRAKNLFPPFLKGDKGEFFAGQKHSNRYELGERVLCLEKSLLTPLYKGGNLHSFMNWQHPLLSDSGGFQVFSLIHKNPKMGKIFDDKVVFKSPIDGSQHELTPEKSIQIQFDLGVDMMVCLDDCPPNDFAPAELENSVRRTIAWAKKCRKEYDKQLKKRKIKDGERPLLFSVIQGGKSKELRKYCSDELIKIGFDGYGFGAMPIDENGNFLEDALQYTAELIPENALRFALGIGTPEDILRCVAYGWDMFDCVIPTREGRHGKLFLWNNKTQNSKFKTQKLGGNFYKTINTNNSKFAKDFSAINENSKLPELRNHTKAYLRHLFKMKEPMGARLASLNNLEFYIDIMKMLRENS